MASTGSAGRGFTVVWSLGPQSTVPLAQQLQVRNVESLSRSRNVLEVADEVARRGGLNRSFLLLLVRHLLLVAMHLLLEASCS